jgi:hypothetical protein
VIIYAWPVVLSTKPNHSKWPLWPSPGAWSKSNRCWGRSLGRLGPWSLLHRSSAARYYSYCRSCFSCWPPLVNPHVLGDARNHVKLLPAASCLQPLWTWTPAAACATCGYSRRRHPRPQTSFPYNMLPHSTASACTAVLSLSGP